ncbi:Signal transduction histidine kinase [Blastococcus mobilis]|uniref:histidine kinase n=1 Tax=Blastococcus mobilis TaxID=1938746 RepID=A0A238ZBS6_9ACTN|nr:Signal transduction histidine kinase [Blastococcus mobilis]
MPLPVLVRRLSRSVVLSAAAGLAGILGVALVYAAVLRSGWVLLILVTAVLHQAALAWILLLCRRGAVARAAVLFCLADWLIVVAVLLVVPEVAPALVPIIVARIVSTLPYLDRAALLRLVAASLAVGLAVGTLSRLHPLGVEHMIPGWVITAFVVVFVPVALGIVGLDLWQHSATLLELTQRALRANARLQASERALAEQAAELRRSRARLVAAADEERRRVERDLHDGAQQTLIGLCLEVSLLAEQAPEGARLRTQLRRLEETAQEAVTELRELAHGLYPPVLATQGLASALQAVLRRSRLPVRAEVAAIGRRPPEQEAAVYFCCREALQNVEKHAGPGAEARVALAEDPDGTLRFSVVDSGRGLDPGRPDGHGLISMRDRLAAVGGYLEVSSSPRGGTRVAGTIPPAHPGAVGLAPTVAAGDST